MKRSAALVIIALAVAPGATPLSARPDAPGAAAAALDKVKALAGEWQTKDSEGNLVEVSYRVISGGSAVMEEMSHGSMVTMYHLDGERLVATHYCEAKNQPRMVTEPIKGDASALKFTLKDITNLAKPTDPHMRALVVTFKDADHFSQQWTFSQDGKDSSEVFTYERKK